MYEQRVAVGYQAESEFTRKPNPFSLQQTPTDRRAISRAYFGPLSVRCAALQARLGWSSPAQPPKGAIPIAALKLFSGPPQRRPGHILFLTPTLALPITVSADTSLASESPIPRVY